MTRLTFLALTLAAAIAFSGCSNEAKYRRYVKSSIRAKEKRQKEVRKAIDRQNRETYEAVRDAEPPPPAVSAQ